MESTTYCCGTVRAIARRDPIAPFDITCAGVELCEGVIKCSDTPSPASSLPQSESGKSLRTIVWNLHASNFLERAIRLRRVTHQLRGVPIDLVEIVSIRRNPAITRAAANISTERPVGAVSRDLRARRIARDAELSTVDVEGGDVAVPEVRSVQHSVIRRDRQRAQFSGLACARVERHEGADAEPTIFVDVAYADAVADGISEDECIRPIVQEGDIERRTASPVMKCGRAERAVRVDAEYDEPIGIWCIRSDRS